MLHKIIDFITSFFIVGRFFRESENKKNKSQAKFTFIISFFSFLVKHNSFCLWYVYNVLICDCLVVVRHCRKANSDAGFDESYSAWLYNRITTENQVSTCCKTNFKLLALLCWESDRCKRDRKSERENTDKVCMFFVAERKSVQKSQNASMLWMDQARENRCREQNSSGEQKTTMTQLEFRWLE